MEEINNLVYSFVINSIGFLKTLEKQGIRNIQTSSYSKIVKEFNTNFNIFYENKSNFQSDKIVIIALLEKIMDFLIKNFEGINDEITYEKADLYRQTNEILTKFSK